MPASSTAKSPACEDGKRSATKSSKVPVKPGSPASVGQLAIARVTDVWNRRTCLRSGQPLDLDQERAGLAVERAADDLDLHVGPLALVEVGDLVGAVLGAAEQDAVVVVRPVVAAVVEVGVEAVLVVPRVEHAQAHLLRGAVGARDVGPARRGRRARPAGTARCRRTLPGGRTGARTTRVNARRVGRARCSSWPRRGRRGSCGSRASGR